jgi:hypothetical protein
VCATVVVAVTVPLPVGLVSELIVRETAEADVIDPVAGVAGVSSAAVRLNVNCLVPVLVHARLTTLNVDTVTPVIVTLVQVTLPFRTLFAVSTVTSVPLRAIPLVAIALVLVPPLVTTLTLPSPAPVGGVGPVVTV